MKEVLIPFSQELLRAISFALYKHSNQRRKARDASFVPYMVHPIETVSILVDAGICDLITLQVAILHDVLEDTECTEEELSMMFGNEVRVLVGALTNTPGISGDEKRKYQISCMQRADCRARMVKIADKTSNLRDLVRCPPGWKTTSVVAYTTSAYQVMKAADHGDIPEPLLRSFWQAYAGLQEWINERKETTL